MKESLWGWWITVLGIIIIGVIMLVTDMSTTSEQDYLMTKEISEAAMYEAVDVAYYRKYGELRINSEKYMENFIRRFSEVISINKDVKITFYDIYEAPPKVGVEVSTTARSFSINGESSVVQITNRLDAILELATVSDPQ